MWLQFIFFSNKHELGLVLHHYKCQMSISKIYYEIIKSLWLFGIMPDCKAEFI